MNWSGVWTALLTPFRDGAVDVASLEKLLAHQVKNGVKGFVINGTTGESPVLSREERERIFKIARAQTKVPLMMGTGTNDTAETVRRTQEAQALGADAALVVVPYYNKPPQRGLVEHFRAVASATPLPVFLYNVPGRTITGLAVESIAELAKTKNIVGIKEATGDIELAKKIKAACPREFILLSGDDGTYPGFLEAGGHGVISVASHVIPAEFVRAQNLARYTKLIDLLFCEANPIPVKKAAQLMGLIATAEMRLPLVEMDPAKARELENEMRAVGVLT